MHYRTLPVFLDVLREGPGDLRLAALIHLAYTAPETMGTNRQLRIMPEIRQSVVRACEDENGGIADFAQSVISTFRWQRTAYESQRIRRHYLAASADLEALATETLALDREFAKQPSGIESLVSMRAIYDVQQNNTFMLPLSANTPLAIANTTAEVEQLVDVFFQKTNERQSIGTKLVTWKIDSTNTDQRELYFVVEAQQTSDSWRPKLLFIVPRPSMLAEASTLPDTWFERVNRSERVQGPAYARSREFWVQPNETVSIQFGSVARDNKDAFTDTCDLFASRMTYYAQLVIDREVKETPETLTWSGRFAHLRQHSPRFFEQGGDGSSLFGGGGWDFLRLSFTCSRRTGAVTLSVEPIEYQVSQLPPDVLTPEWTTQELKLIGWGPLDSLDYFGQKLFPQEYREAIDNFDSNDANSTRQKLYRRYHIEKTLPSPDFMLGLLYERAGNREAATQQMRGAADRAQYDPGLLAEIARWELKTKRYSDARQFAEAALKLWPGQPLATEVIKQLDKEKSGE